MKQSIELKKYILIILALVILATLSKVMLLGTGNAHPTVREITLVCFLIIILSSSNKAYWYIGFPIIIVNALYTPIGLNFGSQPTNIFPLSSLQMQWNPKNFSHKSL